jgi:uncharacterized protein YjbJ (UPF0337 family)
MNWNQIEGQWTQIKGRAKSQWGKLTDDDLANIAGKKDQLVGKLQEHYGLLMGDAETQIDKWIAKMGPLSPSKAIAKPDRGAGESGTHEAVSRASKG